MAQMLTERGTSTSPTGAITVADLLSRYAPEPTTDPEPEPATAPVSVGSLLRREGREPHAAARPIQARAARQAGVYDDEDEDGAATPGRRGPALRRSAIAAGILLAAGSVFGATAVMSTSTSPAGGDPRPAGGYPGQGLLDPQQQASDGAVPTVVDNTAQSDPLDPGTGAPTSWMSTAFPAGNGGGPATAPSGPTRSTVPAAGGAEAPQGSAAPSGAVDTEDDTPSGDRDGNGSNSPEQGGGNEQAEPDGDQGGSGQQEASGGDGVVGGAVEDLGSALPDPLGNPVQSLGRTVAGLL